MKAEGSEGLGAAVEPCRDAHRLQCCSSLTTNGCWVHAGMLLMKAEGSEGLGPAEEPCTYYNTGTCIAKDTDDSNPLLR